MSTTEILKIGSEYFVNGLVMSCVYVVVVLIIAHGLKALIAKLFARQKVKTGHTAENAYGFLRKCCNAFISIIALVLILMQVKALQHVGTAVIGASSVLAVVAGIAAQESFANFIGGLFIAISQPFMVGDLITVKDVNVTGVVKEISFRQTTLHTFANTSVIIPNKVMNTAVIENKDHKDRRICNFLTVNISYDSNIDQAMTIIQEEAMKHPLFLDGRSKHQKETNAPAVPVVVMEWGDYALNLRASIYSENSGDGFAMLCDLRKSIKERFDVEGVRIPFPTQINYVIQGKE